ncbi:MAG: hypothetical protein AAGJ81_00300 [Verrucomicrobiota bacterium]
MPNKLILFTFLGVLNHHSLATTPWLFHGKGDSVQYTAPPAPSAEFRGVEFTGRYANYTRADTWYPTWAADGKLYSPWTDGTIGPDMKFVWSGDGKDAKTGYATIEGDDPLNLTITDVGILTVSALPFQGRYPCGSLHYDGVWYYGSYGIDQVNEEIKKDYGWYVLGHFAGFHWSEDNGKTWNLSPHTTDAGLFAEPKRSELDLELGKEGPFVKMGAPHFVDFGQNMEHSPDGKAYLVGHGSEFPDASPRKANNSWVTGDAVYMTRVLPSIENMNDASKYEFFAGHDSDGIAIWTKDFKKIKPIFEWNNHCGIVTMTYNPSLRKYFMCITDGHMVTTSRREYDSYVLESDSLTGPWSIVAYMSDFGPQAYFLNIPSKFTSDDGMTMWLSYSANYMNGNNRNNPDYVKETVPAGSAYSFSLHEFSLLKKSESN